jgi:hypothetical protein
MIMKRIHLIAAGLLLAASTAMAQPWAKTGIPIQRIHNKAQVDQIDKGAQLVLVCKGSDTVTLINIKDRKEALELCADGRMVHCRDCRKKFHVVWRNPLGKGPGPKSTMEIVNEKGEPCMFLARIR